MINAAVLEWLGDQAFVIVITIASVAMITYLWAKFNNREKTR